MFMGDEKEGKTLAFLVARERATRTVLSTVVPTKSTGQRICRRLMAWLREIGLEFVDIIVKIRQRTGSDKLDQVMEHAESDEERIEDDHREQSSGQFKQQRDRRERHSVGAGNDQNNTRLNWRNVGGEG